MEINMLSQIYLFGFSLIFGIILGMIFDIFRIFDIILVSTLKQIFFEDILYFMIIGVLSFLFMILTNKGEFRIFIVFGELIGFSIYHFIVGRVVVKFFEKFIYFIKKKLIKIKIRLESPIHNLILKIKKLPRHITWQKKIFKRKKII